VQVVSIATVATTLGVSKTTIYRLIASGRLPAYRVGHQFRINADDVTAALRPVIPTVGHTGDTT
jgi:excisionase family DNA binding protein